MPHTTETPTAKRPHWLLIVGGILFLLAFLRPDLAQKMAGKPGEEVTSTSTAPQHFDGEVVSIVSSGDYVHPSKTFTGGTLIVRDKGGAEFVVYPHELNVDITASTTKLIKTVHNGKLSFSPWRDDLKVETASTGLKAGYDYIAVDQYGNVTRSDGKPISDEEKERQRQIHANFLTTRVVEKFGANSTESKKLDGMRQNYASDTEIIQAVNEMLPEYPTTKKALQGNLDVSPNKTHIKKPMTPDELRSKIDSVWEVYTDVDAVNVVLKKFPVNSTESETITRMYRAGDESSKIIRYANQVLAELKKSQQ